MQIIISRTTDFACFGVFSVVPGPTNNDFGLRTIPYLLAIRRAPNQRAPSMTTV